MSARRRVAFDREHRSGGADSVGEGDREKADTGIQVQDPLPGLGVERTEDPLDKDRGRAGVDLPEPSRRNLELPCPGITFDALSDDGNFTCLLYTSRCV